MTSHQRRVKITAFMLPFLVFIGGTSCGKNAPDSPITGLKTGNSVVFVEVADTQEGRARGLMFRQTLASNAGMLFVFEEPQIPGFYMKNTPLPLDILFIDEAMKIVSIRQMASFDDKTIHRPDTPAKYALEVNAGWSTGHNVKTGDKVIFTYQEKR